jgi:predicted nuclease of restriction endonuclease-like (RecB) superfamily
MNLPALVTEIQSLDTALVGRAVSAINVALTARNWLVGAYIVEFEQNGEDRAKYGERLISELGKKLKAAGVKGLAATPLRHCRSFYLCYPSIRQSLSGEFGNVLTDNQLQLLSDTGEIRPTASGEFTFRPQRQIGETLSDESTILGSVAGELAEEIPKAPPYEILTTLSFSHIVELLKIDDPLKRAFYEIEAINGHWSVRQLKRQAGSLLFERTGLSKDKGKLIELANTGAAALEPRDIIRDPYIFEFLGLRPRETVEESDLESALLDHLQAFLLELGRGFCFEDRQRKILIGSEHYFVDLVFYHRVLKCNVLIELKVEPFNHQNAGQLNTYLNWYREHEMHEGDKPPVGILLCTDKKAPLAKYALGGMDENLFVSDYQLQLPELEELQAFLARELAASSHMKNAKS